MLEVACSRMVGLLGDHTLSVVAIGYSVAFKLGFITEHNVLQATGVLQLVVRNCLSRFTLGLKSLHMLEVVWMQTFLLWSLQYLRLRYVHFTGILANTFSLFAFSSLPYRHSLMYSISDVHDFQKSKKGIFLWVMELQRHVAEKYCWVITQAIGRSCCGRSGSGVLEFEFQLSAHLYTYIFDHMCTKFWVVQNWTCAIPYRM